MDSTYKHFYITYSDVINATNGANFNMQFIIGGSTKSDNHYPYGNNSRNSSSGFGGNESGDSTSIKLSKSNLTDHSARGVSGDLHVFNPASTSTYKKVMWSNVYMTAPTVSESNKGAGMYKNSTAAMTGVSFLMTSGNITSGLFKLYGVT